MRAAPVLSRRLFVRGASGGVLALPLLCEPRGSARAALSFPRRLVICFSSNGTVPGAWHPRSTNPDLMLGEIMAPLEPHKRDLIILDDMWNPAAWEVTSRGMVDAHQAGPSCLLTGIETLLGNQAGTVTQAGHSGFAGGISVDQLIANRIAQSTNVQFPSLEFSTKTMAGNVMSRLSYKGADVPVTPMDNPSAAFDRIFGSAAGDAATMARLRAERKSILDNSIAELAALAGKLSRVDRRKIETHRDALASLERSLMTGGSGTEQRCAKAPPRSNLKGTKEPQFPLGDFIDADGDRDIPERHTAIRQMLVGALACDLTRVATVMMAPSRSPIVPTWLGINEAHHSISHVEDNPRGRVPAPNLIKINQFYAGEVAKIIQDLKDIPEGSGSLFDSTVVVWCNDMGHGSEHDSQHPLFVLAGSAGGYFRTGGRFIETRGANNNDLLISLCHGMGFTDISSVGNPKYCRGPLGGLAA